MGTGEWAVQTCSRSKDGLLLHAPSDVLEGCAPGYPTFLDGDDAQFDEDLACIATLGTGGCGMEQPLLAARRALVDHANGPNAGFRRADSVVAIVVMSDEDDCSAEDTSLFDTQSPLGPLNLRCSEHADYLYAVDALVEAVADSVPDPSWLVLAAILGTPLDLVDTGALAAGDFDLQGAGDFAAALADPRMQFVVDGTGEALETCCEDLDRGVAYPGRRLMEAVAWADANAGGGLVQSICTADQTPALIAIARTIQGALR
jgi:hypothetical protein